MFAFRKLNKEQGIVGREPERAQRVALATLLFGGAAHGKGLGTVSMQTAEGAGADENIN